MLLACRKPYGIQLCRSQPCGVGWLQGHFYAVHPSAALCADPDCVLLACRKRNAIDLAVQQQGSAAARKSTEQAAEQAAKKGSSVGLLKVLLKEPDHDNIQMVQLAAKPLLLQELKVCLCPSLEQKG